jgi:alpha/beta superfamily hydrolase
MQEKHKYGLWGAAAGALTLAVVGFSWGGWVTGSTAKMQADAAGWSALLPVCADAILGNPAALAELKTKRTIDYDDVVRDHLKVIAGRGDLSFAFRRDCGKTIEARLQSAAVKN